MTAKHEQSPLFEDPKFVPKPEKINNNIDKEWEKGTELMGQPDLREVKPGIFRNKGKDRIVVLHEGVEVEYKVDENGKLSRGEDKVHFKDVNRDKNILKTIDNIAVSYFKEMSPFDAIDTAPRSVSAKKSGKTWGAEAAQPSEKDFPPNPDYNPERGNK